LKTIGHSLKNLGPIRKLRPLVSRAGYGPGCKRLCYENHKKLKESGLRVTNTIHGESVEVLQ